LIGINIHRPRPRQPGEVACCQPFCPRLKLRGLQGEARPTGGVSPAHRGVGANWSGLTHANLIKTGDRTFCIIAEWTDMGALAKARTDMSATLDRFRDTLEDLDGGLVSPILNRDLWRWR
jgi:hypothetical protein